MSERMDVDEPSTSVAPSQAKPFNAMSALMAGAKAKGKEKEVTPVNDREGLPWCVSCSGVR